LSGSTRRFAVSVLIWLALAFFVAYLFQSESDRAIPVGAAGTVDIEVIPPELHKERLIELISAWSKDSRTNVYKVTADPGNLDGGRVLYEFLGHPVSAVGGNSREYPTFSPWFETRIEPSSKIGDADMRGSYAVYGDDGRLDLLMRALREDGIVVVPGTWNPGDLVGQLVAARPTLVGVVAIAALVLSLGTATFATRRQAVSLARKLLGCGYGRVLSLDYGVAILVYLGMCAVVCLAGLPFIWISNDFHQIWSLLRSVLLIDALGLLLVLAAWTVVRMRFQRMSTADVIKGRRPWLTLQVLSWATTTSSFALVFVILGTTTATLSSLDTASRSDASWKALGQAVTLRFASTTTAEDFDRLSDRFGSLYRIFDAKNQVVLAKPPTAPVLRGGQHGPFDGNSLIINPEYLARNVILDAAGRRVDAMHLEPGEMGLLIPRTLWEKRSRIEAEYREWANFQRSERGESLDVVIHVVAVEADQEMFNIGANDFAFGSSQKDPVMAVMAGNSNIVPPDFYVSAASNGALVFDDANSLREALTRSGIATHVVSIDSAAGLALSDRSKRVGLLLGLVLGGFVVLLAMILSTATVTWVYLGRRRAVVVARMTHGHSFSGRHSALQVAGLTAGTVAALVATAAGALTGCIAFAGAIAVLGLYWVTVLALLHSGERALFAELRSDA
jgi:hypothetical protein